MSDPYTKPRPTIDLQEFESRLRQPGPANQNAAEVLTELLQIINSPTFDWHMINLRNYIALNPRNVPPVKIAGETFKQLGQGSGMLGLPGDFSPPARFVGQRFSARPRFHRTRPKRASSRFSILNNFDIPVGVAREVTDGVAHTDYTMLTTARDPQSLRYYYKSNDDQTIRVVDLKKFDLRATAIRMLSTKSEQPIVDVTATVK